MSSAWPLSSDHTPPPTPTLALLPPSLAMSFPCHISLVKPMHRDWRSFGMAAVDSHRLGQVYGVWIGVDRLCGCGMKL